MASSPTLLADQLDSWCLEDRIGVVETAAAVVVSRLDEADVRTLAQLLTETGWGFAVEDDALQPIPVDMVDDVMGPYILTFGKPVSEGVVRIVTCEGLRQILLDDEASGSFEIASAKTGFATGLSAFNPWGAGEIFSPATETKSPRQLVRDTSAGNIVPADVRRWLLRSVPTQTLWNDRAFRVFADLAAVFLLRSLGSEVPSVDTVVFGPPRSVAKFRPSELAQMLELQGFVALHASAAWVYEDPRAAEQRHTLLGAEFARSHRREQVVGVALRDAGSDMLESARLAYQLSLSDISREAIKAQGDLRKAVAEDTAKAADSTRTLSNAIAVALATGIGLVAARTASSTEPWILSAVGAVVGSYLLVVTLSGWMFLHSQRRLRAQWRVRFYGFVSTEDYEAMVERPTEEAEIPYHLVGVVALIVAAMMFVFALTKGNLI